MLISKCHSDGPAEASGLPEAHGPPKVHGPRGHCTPLPLPLDGPGSEVAFPHTAGAHYSSNIF